MLLEHKTGLRYAHIHTQTIMDHLHAAPTINEDKLALVILCM